MITKSKSSTLQVCTTWKKAFEMERNSKFLLIVNLIKKNTIMIHYENKFTKNIRPTDI